MLARVLATAKLKCPLVIFEVSGVDQRGKSRHANVASTENTQYRHIDDGGHMFSCSAVK